MSEPQQPWDQPASDPAPAPDQPFAAGGYPVPVAPAPAPRVPWVTRRELTDGGLTVLVLIVLGVLLGFGWHVWSDTATRGLVYYKKAIVPDETEGFVSSDGRFVVLTALAGLLAGVVTWVRPGTRGPVGVASLAAGTLLGSLATGLIGRLVGGGSTAGAIGTQLSRLPLEVHARGLFFVEGFLALLVYLLCALFVSRDDFGVEPPAPPAQFSVGAERSA